MNTPDAPKVPGLVVASARAGDGKTAIAAGICLSLRTAGARAEPWLPIVADARRTAAGVLSDSAALLAASAESRRTLDEIAPVRLRPAPTILEAARPVDVPAVLSAAPRDESIGALIVEAPGGLGNPWTNDFGTLDFLAWARWPVVLVCRPEPPGLEVALLAIRALRSVGVRLAGVIVNRYRPESDPGELPWMEAMPTHLAAAGETNLLTRVPDDSATDIRQARLGPNLRYALDQVDWRSHLG